MKRAMILLAMAALVLAGMAGCTGGELVDEQHESKSKTVTLTTTVSCGAAGTKAVTPSGVKTFDVGDRIAVIYKNQNGETKVAESHKLTSADISGEGELENKIATFTVSLDDPKASAPVRYIYPYYMCNRYAASSEAVNSEAFINYDALKTDQCGLIEVLGNNFDLAIFDGAMTSDLKLPASATLENQLAICAFTLKDSDGTNTITNGLRQLTVSDGENTYVVDPIKDGYPFGEDVVYVAIKPVTTATSLKVTATDGTTNYTKTLSSRQYLAGNGYNISLKMYEVWASNEYKKATRSGSTVNFSKETATNPTEISNGFSGSITSGWYTVTGDNVVINGNIEPTDETCLILCDGAKLTVYGQILVNHSLYIYGQDAGTGKLIIENDRPAMSITGTALYIHGGDISMTSSGNSCAVLLLTSYFYMFGGILTANSNISGRYATIYISGSNYYLTVYGGKLSASNPNGNAIDGKVRSGLNTIKFYWSDTKDVWDDGHVYNSATDAPNHGYHYALAE